MNYACEVKGFHITKTLQRYVTHKEPFPLFPPKFSFVSLYIPERRDKKKNTWGGKKTWKNLVFSLLHKQKIPHPTHFYWYIATRGFLYFKSSFLSSFLGSNCSVYRTNPASAFQAHITRKQIDKKKKRRNLSPNPFFSTISRCSEPTFFPPSLRVCAPLEPLPHCETGRGPQPDPTSHWIHDPLQ